VKPTVMWIGLGGLGGVLLELLARAEGIGQKVVGSRNVEHGIARSNLARLGALAQGLHPAIRFAALDLRETEATAATSAREAPDVIVSTATTLAWWLPDLLPAPHSVVTLAHTEHDVETTLDAASKALDDLAS
jgi:hypothetical protein